jgi:hypothetical protein
MLDHMLNQTAKHMLEHRLSRIQLSKSDHPSTMQDTFYLNKVILVEEEFYLAIYQTYA